MNTKLLTCKSENFVIDKLFVNYLSSFVNELFKIIFEVFTDLPIYKVEGELIFFVIPK